MSNPYEMPVNSRQPWDGFVYRVPHLYKMGLVPVHCRWCAAETIELVEQSLFGCPNCDSAEGKALPKPDRDHD